VRQRETLDRTALRLQPAAGRAIGLGQYKDDFVARRHEARQRPLGELGRAGED
jgi:hypothetical protein